ncbi:Pre-mRNA cleavage complex 2 protein Pcf11 [Oryzias melastigma]|uniref:Pre-mRNA cleavage complex 2 protein Pcf11 n=1 Tax=Oryzias melastigma TaxID=30732 RepID=A0A834FT45_ORYME|nr:Pre-mRNA cleavage complex 2 protein Pcf11 [Oryzias melastigma]
MEDGAARQDACREYQSSLEDLTFNSKPHINMLTILAEENLQFAKDIVAIIEAQITKAPPSEKLPVLYLVDSIVKNVGGEYLAEFAKNLVTSFICVFEKVDENTRKSLFKLRSTWDEVFPTKKLYLLDVRVNSLDPAWPIKPLPPTVNSSIHINPKFFKQTEEPPSPQPAPAQPPPPPVAPKPPSTAGQSSLTQEQLIRQQLLAKQKQLLELQQKKIELELEQTKAQLAVGFSLQQAPAAPPQAAPSPFPKPLSQSTPVIRPWIPPQPQPDPKLPTRDPRLNRPALTPVQSKEPPVPRKEASPSVQNLTVTPEKRLPEKPVKPDRTRALRKDTPDEKSKYKLPKSVQNQKEAVEAEPKPPEKKDPRLKKRLLEPKDDEPKDKKRSSDKKERDDVPRSNKSKLHNGAAAKHEREDAGDKAELKSGGNARTHARKRTRSRSRSPNTSPKRKDRRSPKSRPRSSSPSPHKPGKPRRVRPDNLTLNKPGHDERLATKKNQADSRRPKRPVEERHVDSLRISDGGAKDGKEAHRWRSGWENKHLKLEESHPKAGPQRHKPYGGPARPSTPRTPKHRLSVDANLQIPEVLNSASKKDLLMRASKRVESGEISQEDFLSMAHQINHLFQYQEEKQLRSDSWGGPGELPPKKQAVLTTPGSMQPHSHMDPAELSYFKHKSKLKRTQVNHGAANEDWESQDSLEGGGDPGPAGSAAIHPPSHKFSRPPRDRQGERRSKEREESRPPLAPMIEDYNHGKEFPTLKSLPDLRFRRRADPRKSSEREWTSPLERQLYKEKKGGYDAPRRYEPRHSEPRRPEGPPLPEALPHRNCPSPGGLETMAPQFRREPLSPPRQGNAADSPVARFESPNSEHSDDGPIILDPHLPPQHMLKGPAFRPHGNSPGHTPPHDGGHPPRYSGPAHIGPARPHPPGWTGGHMEEPHHQGPGRFDGGGPSHLMVDMTEPHQGPGRFGAPMGQQPGPGRGPGPMDGSVQHFDPPGPFGGPMGFQQQHPPHFEDLSNQLRPPRLDNPVCFDRPGQPVPRFDMPNAPVQGGGAHYDFVPGQQGPPRFGPQQNLQPLVRPMVPDVYNNPMPPQQNFGMAPQPFQEPMNPQFAPAPMAAANFNPQFGQPGPGPFYNPPAPTINMQQPVMANMNPPFLPQNQGPFGQQAPQVPSAGEHFGQVDVESLLSKLISTGIIKPSQPDPALPVSSESPAAPAPPPEPEEEEEQEVEENDIPDLTGFSIEPMKQRYESVVTKLYTGNQCCLCSMRFTTAQTDMYADHLDWHFRQNHAGKQASKKVTHRRWYYSLTDWIEFEEIADLEERAKSQFFEKENEEEVQKTQAAAKEKEFQSVRATKDQVGELCEICQEPFETYWVEEEEDWFLKNAIKVDEKNFHPSCFEDYKNTSSYLDATPSPSKLLTEHPLGAFKTDEEPTSCAMAAASVKQEVESPQEEDCEPPGSEEAVGGTPDAAPSEDPA